jgi:hypothetical protein
MICFELNIPIHLFSVGGTLKVNSPRSRMVGSAHQRLQSSLSMRDITNDDTQCQAKESTSKEIIVVRPVQPTNSNRYFDNKASHAFLALNSNPQFPECEYCLGQFSGKGQEDAQCAFRCESTVLLTLGCNYTCHKACRSLIHVECAKITGYANEAEAGSAEVLNLKSRSPRKG